MSPSATSGGQARARLSRPSARRASTATAVSSATNHSPPRYMASVSSGTSTNAVDDRGQAREARQLERLAATGPGRGAGPAGHGDGQQGAGQQLEGPRGGAEVDAGGVAGTEGQRGRHRRHRERPEHGQPRTARSGVAGDEGGHHGHHQVELLLDGQRPVVLHHAGLLVVLAVRRALGDEVPVGHVRGGRGHVAGQRPQLVRVADRGRHRHRHDQSGQRCGHEAPEAAAPEPPEADATAGARLGHQQRRDEVPGEHEEDGDAEVATRQQRRLEVVDDHGGHGEAPEPVEAPQPAAGRAPRVAGGRRRAGVAVTGDAPAPRPPRRPRPSARRDPPGSPAPPPQDARPSSWRRIGPGRGGCQGGAGGVGRDGSDRGGVGGGCARS